MAARQTRLPGHVWRILAWKRESGEKVAMFAGKRWSDHQPHVGDDVCFDELVIDDWFHLEQMNDRHWWLGLGRDGNLLHIRIEIPAKGQIEVGIDNDEGDQPIVTYFNAPIAERKAV